MKNTFLLILIFPLFLCCYSQTIKLNKDASILEVSCNILYSNDFVFLINNIDELTSLKNILNIILDREKITKYTEFYDQNAVLSDYIIQKKDYGYDIFFSITIPVDDKTKTMGYVFFPLLVENQNALVRATTKLDIELLGNSSIIYDLYNYHVPKTIDKHLFENDILKKLSKNDRDRDYISSLYVKSDFNNSYFFTSKFINIDKHYKDRLDERKKVSEIFNKIKYENREKTSLDNYTKTIQLNFNYLLPNPNISILKDNPKISNDKKEIIYTFTLYDILTTRGKDILLSFNK